MRVAITGASGFIGSHLVRRLATDGDEVVAIARSFSADDTAPGIRRATLALDDEAALSAAIEGVDAVVHLAARVHRQRENRATALELHLRENRDLTAKVFREAVRAGARRFVFLSSIAAVGEHRTVDERTIPLPTTPYGIAKRTAEEFLLAEAPATNCSITILRPPGVYGPKMRGNLLSLFALIERGVPVPIVRPAPVRSFIYVENLTDAIVMALRSRQDSSNVYSVADGDRIPLDDLVALVSECVGRRPRILPVPRAFLSMSKTAIRLVNPLGLKINPSAVDRATADLEVRSDAFERDFGWQPPVCSRDGWTVTGRWFADLGRPHGPR